MVVREELPYRKCVGVIVFNPEGKVWAGHRIADTETPLSHLWQLPQGGIDKGEDPESAARRELYEETGISSASLIGTCEDWLNYDLPDHLIGVALKGKYRGQTQKWFAFRFEGDESEINITNPPNGTKPEFDAWAWKDLADMPNLIVPFKRQIYDRLVVEFG